MNSKSALVLTFVSVLGLSSGSFAQTTTETAQSAPSVRQLTESDAISLSLRHNPSVAQATLSEMQASQAVRSEQARYPFVLQADAGYTHNTSPSLGPNGTVLTGTRDGVSLGSTLRKDFATGTSVALSLRGDRTTTTRAVGPLVTAGNAGTGYSLSTRLSVAQPILRGAGTRIGEAQLRAARLDMAARQETRGRLTSEVLRDTLAAYWELWYASRALGIEQAARTLAMAQRAEAAARLDKGAIAAADIFTFDSYVATRNELVTAAELAELDRGITLAQTLGIEAPSERLRATGEPTEPGMKTVAEVAAKLIERSPELQELQAKYELAQSRAEVAGDAYRPRLDVEGYVELRGLGNNALAPALTQVGTAGAVSGYVGMVFEAPLGSQRESAEVKKARLDARIAKSQLDAAQNRARMVAVQLVAQLDGARVRRQAAEQTFKIAEKQLEAEQARYALGASTPIQIQVAEDTLRQAKLRIERARVDQVRAALAIEHLTGGLLARYAATADPTDQ